MSNIEDDKLQELNEKSKILDEYVRWIHNRYKPCCWLAVLFRNAIRVVVILILIAFVGAMID